jgi:hypothetical protein
MGFYPILGEMMLNTLAVNVSSLSKLIRMETIYSPLGNKYYHTKICMQRYLCDDFPKWMQKIPQQVNMRLMQMTIYGRVF